MSVRRIKLLDGKTRKKRGPRSSSLTSSYIIRHGRSNGIWSLRISIGKKHPGCTESPYVTMSLTFSSDSMHHIQNSIPQGYTTLSPTIPLPIVAMSSLFRVQLKTIRTDHAYLSRRYHGLFRQNHGQVFPRAKLRSIRCSFQVPLGLGFGLVTTRDIPISMTPGRRGVPLFRVSTLWCVLLFYQ